MTFSLFDIVFYWAGLATHASIVFLLFRKHLAGRFPYATATNIGYILVDVVLYAIRSDRHLYFWGYITLQVLVMFGLNLLLYSEMTADAFPFRFNSKAGLVIMGCASLAWLLVHANAPEPTAMYHAVLSLDQALAMFQCVMLLALAAYLFSRGYTWRHYSHGFITGLGVSSIASLVISITQQHLGAGYIQSMYQMRTLMQFSGLLVWLVILILPEPSLHKITTADVHAAKRVGNLLEAQVDFALRRGK